MSSQPALRVGAVITTAFVLALSFVLLIAPASSRTMGAISDAGQVGGPFLIFCFWLVMLVRAWRQPAFPVNRKLFWAQLILGTGLGFELIAQLGWTVNEQILHTQPFPSWTDVLYLAVYPCFFAAIFLLPGRRGTNLAGFQVGLDALATTVAAATFSWYFLIGPVVLDDGASRLNVVVASLYPIFDLILFACVIALWIRSSGHHFNLVLGLLTASTLMFVVADSGFQYFELSGTYRSGTILDIGWVVADMLAGLAAIALLGEAGRKSGSSIACREASAPAVFRESPPWIEFLPYIALPVMLGFFVSLWHTPGDGDDVLEPGVLLGCVLFTVIVVMRQFLSLRENQRLHRAAWEDASRLAEVNREVVASNQELARANARLESLATTDPLTNLLNHRAINDRIDQEIERAYRYGREFSLLFVDLDHFKTINDSYGHAAGDIALMELVDVVRQSVRGVDVVARWGGEEFVVLLPEVDGVAAVECAERVRESVARHRYQISGGIHLTCSIGVATYPDDATERGTLIEVADQAMYVAKRLGRNQVRRCGEEAVAALSGGDEDQDHQNDATLIGVVEALAAMVEARDRYTGRQMAQVGRLSARLALQLGLTPSEAQQLGIAGVLHDIGKVAVPDAILQAPVGLTVDQWKSVRFHAIVGADIVNRVPALRPVAAIIRGHHERWDGLGYPDGLAGYYIPYGARIVAVVDAYGAMTSNRPYRAGRSPEAAYAELRRNAGTQFDPVVVDAFLSMIEADEIAAESQVESSQFARLSVSD